MAVPETLPLVLAGVERGAADGLGADTRRNIQQAGLRLDSVALPAIEAAGG